MDPDPAKDAPQAAALGSWGPGSLTGTSIGGGGACFSSTVGVVTVVVVVDGVLTVVSIVGGVPGV